jgi:predicted DsbA family dithiol-disulfide isomerase
MALEIEVFSDVICPWCFIGKRRLERALRLLEGTPAVRVTWRAFELNPGMPPEGIPRRDYRTGKFGSWERSQELDARVAQAGAPDGIEFQFERMERTPNTTDAHRLLGLGLREGCQDAVAERLFRGYFLEGRDIGDRETLVETAAAAGLNADAARRYLASDAGTAEVREDEARAHRLGVHSVPTFLVDGRAAIEGAQPPELLAAALRKLAGS